MAIFQRSKFMQGEKQGAVSTPVRCTGGRRPHWWYPRQMAPCPLRLFLHFAQPSGRFGKERHTGLQEMTEETDLKKEKFKNRWNTDTISHMYDYMYMYMYDYMYMYIYLSCYYHWVEVAWSRRFHAHLCARRLQYPAIISLTSWIWNSLMGALLFPDHSRNTT